MLVLRPPTIEDVERARVWRNEDGMRAKLRTPYMLSREQQEEFYRQSVSNRQANSRWWSVYEDDRFIGLIGLTDIEWENGLGQVSMMVDPELHGRGYGRQAFELLLREAFDRMRLLTVYGECYECNPAISFWRRMMEEYGGKIVMIPRRKFWGGRLWGAMLFTVAAEQWEGWVREHKAAGEVHTFEAPGALHGTVYRSQNLSAESGQSSWPCASSVLA